MRGGWFRESHRHYLASKGVKTSFYAKKNCYFAIDEIRLEKRHPVERVALSRPVGRFERAVGLRKGAAERAVIPITGGMSDALMFVKVSEPNVVYIGKDFSRLVPKQLMKDSEYMDDFLSRTIGHEQMHDLLLDMEAKSEVPIGTSDQLHNLKDYALFEPDMFPNTPVLKGDDPVWEGVRGPRSFHADWDYADDDYVHRQSVNEFHGLPKGYPSFETEMLAKRAKILAERGERVPGLNAPAKEKI